MEIGGWVRELLGGSCAACGVRRAVGEAGALCDACRVAARRWDRGLQSPREGELLLGAAWIYGGAVADAITAMKFRGRPPRVDWLIEGLPELLQAMAPGACLVAVPPQRQRLLRRGFALPDLATGVLSDQTGARVLFALGRTDNNPPRARSPERLPKLEARERGRGREVVLVDDIVTTGDTLRLASQALQEAGFVVSGAICLADAHKQHFEPSRTREERGLTRARR